MSKLISIFRFMSNDEYDLLNRGLTLTNHTDHRAIRGEKVTTSKGFCFGIGGIEEAITHSRRLKGIACMQWLMVAETDEKRLTPSKGWYVTEYDNNGGSFGHAYFDEMCMEEMNRDDFSTMEFYAVRGLSIMPDKKGRRGVAIIGRTAVSRREQETLELANRVALRDSSNLSFRCSVGLTDFTKYQWGLLNL